MAQMFYFPKGDYYHNGITYRVMYDDYGFLCDRQEEFFSDMIEVHAELATAREQGILAISNDETLPNGEIVPTVVMPKAPEIMCKIPSKIEKWHEIMKNDPNIKFDGEWPIIVYLRDV